MGGFLCYWVGGLSGYCGSSYSNFLRLTIITNHFFGGFFRRGCYSNFQWRCINLICFLFFRFLCIICDNYLRISLLRALRVLRESLLSVFLVVGVELSQSLLIYFIVFGFGDSFGGIFISVILNNPRKSVASIIDYNCLCNSSFGRSCSYRFLVIIIIKLNNSSLGVAIIIIRRNLNNCLLRVLRVLRESNFNFLRVFRFFRERIFRVHFHHYPIHIGIFIILNNGNFGDIGIIVIV